MYTARAAALAAIAKYGAAAATPVLHERARRQGLGGARARGDAAEAARSGGGRRRRRADPAGADDAPRRRLRGAAARRTRRSRRRLYIDTDRGTIQIELAVLDAPLTVENFIALARKGYFNGLSIHRVVPDFVVQDGDPRGDGEGGPGLHDPRRAERAAVPARHGRHGARPGPTPAAASSSSRTRRSRISTRSTPSSAA